MLLAGAVIGHGATLVVTPRIIMTRTLSAMEARGVPLHRFVLSPRITPQTQSVVRPSPDLAYSICRYDLDKAPGGVRITAAGGPSLASISVFDATTSNIAAVPVGVDGAAITLMKAGSSDPGVVASPSSKGLVLIRRLAPTSADHDRVRGITVADGCDPLPRDGGSTADFGPSPSGEMPLGLPEEVGRSTIGQRTAPTRQSVIGASSMGCVGTTHFCGSEKLVPRSGQRWAL